MKNDIIKTFLTTFWVNMVLLTIGFSIIEIINANNNLLTKIYIINIINIIEAIIVSGIGIISIYKFPNKFLKINYILFIYKIIIYIVGYIVFDGEPNLINSIIWIVLLIGLYIWNKRLTGKKGE